jgi:hypothetical protein
MYRTNAIEDSIDAVLPEASSKHARSKLRASARIRILFVGPARSALMSNRPAERRCRRPPLASRCRTAGQAILAHSTGAGVGCVKTCESVRQIDLKSPALPGAMSEVFEHGRARALRTHCRLLPGAAQVRRSGRNDVISHALHEPSRFSKWPISRLYVCRKQR